MQLHQLSIAKQKYPKPRVGRGGKRGTTAGRGTKGQRSRAGRRIRPAERDFIQRLPKLRGYKNPARVSGARVALNLNDVQGAARDAVLDLTALREAGYAHRGKKGDRIKILGRGRITRPIIVRGIPVSQEARKKIEAAGGRVIANNANLGK